MTVAELIAKRRKQLQEIVEKNIPFKTAVLSTVDRQSKRIFINGENSAGGKIGQYDTNREMYLNPKTTFAGSKLKPTKGKTGEHTFKNGKEHQTTFVNNYKEFRNRIGRRIDFVNLNLSNDLKSDFDSGLKKVNQNEYIVSVKRGNNANKLQGLEEKYGNIFNLTQGEKTRFNEVLQLELKKILNA